MNSCYAFRASVAATASTALLRLLGYRMLLIHGDPLVLDRWLWLRRRLPRGCGNLLDVGSGNGAFTIGAATLGYHSVGLNFQQDEVAKAVRRARAAAVDSIAFELQDVRALSERLDLMGRFDIVICFENIEHVLNDCSLMVAMAGTLRVGGRLFLTTPSLDYRPIDRTDNGPWLPIEDGRHVRKGYSPIQLETLARMAGLSVLEVSSCSGFMSQKLAGVLRHLSTRVHPVIGWAAVLPFRMLPPVADPIIRAITHWPDYSICMVARRN